MARSGDLARKFWDRAAKDNAAWYVATGFTSEDSAFFDQGAAETDALLRFCGIDITPSDTVLEIGCGVGRMTRRLADLAGKVLAADVSRGMIERCEANRDGRSNVICLVVPGDGTLADVATASVDVVFSYITLQHVSSREAQLLYLRESARTLAPGGRLAVQLRANGPRARALDWLGHVHHLAEGRPTLRRAWRGARLSDRDVHRALAGADLQVEIRRWDRRHRWVVARKR